MEILVEAEKKGVNIAGVLTKLMKLANSGSKFVDFHDADQLPIDPSTLPSGPEFTKRLRVILFGTCIWKDAVVRENLRLVLVLRRLYVVQRENFPKNSFTFRFL